MNYLINDLIYWPLPSTGSILIGRIYYLTMKNSHRTIHIQWMSKGKIFMYDDEIVERDMRSYSREEYEELYELL